MTGRRKILALVGIVVAIGGLVAFSIFFRRDKGVEVRLEPIHRRDLVATVSASGKIVPQRTVDISADITGRITRIAVREGEFVRRGDLLLRIDPSQYQSAVARGRAATSSAEASAVQAAANRGSGEARARSRARAPGARRATRLLGAARTGANGL